MGEHLFQDGISGAHITADGEDGGITNGAGSRTAECVSDECICLITVRWASITIHVDFKSVY